MQDTDCTGKNLGVAKSFGYLLRNAPKAKYYLFCDHDDLWLPNRLSSIERLANDSDLVIHNAETFIEESGSIGGLVISADEFHKNFYDEIFFQNFAPGCCLAVSDRVREELAQAILNEGTEFFLHDWIALVHARAFNFSVAFIPEPGLQYRIHSGNAVGLPGPVKRLLQIFKDRKVIRYVRSYIESMIKVRAILHRAGFSISFSKLFRTCLSSSFGNSVFRRYFFLVVLVLSQINLGFK